MIDGLKKNALPYFIIFIIIIFFSISRLLLHPFKLDGRYPATKTGKSLFPRALSLFKKPSLSEGCILIYLLTQVAK